MAGQEKLAVITVEEDAPPESDAHRRVVFDHVSESWFFRPIPGHARTSRYQVSVRKSGGDENGLRIARICYNKFENGESREEVDIYRQGMYSKLSGSTAVIGGRAKSGAIAETVGGNHVSESGLASEELSSTQVQSTEPLATNHLQTPAHVQASEEESRGDKVEDDNLKTQVKDEEVKTEVKDETAKIETLDDDLLADAPPGHEAYDKCVVNEKLGLPVIVVRYTKDDLSRGQFQIAVTKCANDHEAALRLARNCYVKFESGCAMEEIVAFRSKWYAKLTGKPPPASAMARETSVASVELSPPPEGEKEESQDDKVEDGKVKAEVEDDRVKTEVKEDNIDMEVKDEKIKTEVKNEVKDEKGKSEALDTLPPDAPPGHEAYDKCFIREKRGNAVIQLNILSSTFQIAVNKCANNQEAALRLARSCYVKIESGCSIEELNAFRSEWYTKLKPKTRDDENVRTSASGELAAPSPPATSVESAKNDTAAHSLKDFPFEHLLPADAPLDSEAWAKCKKNKMKDGIYDVRFRGPDGQNFQATGVACLGNHAAAERLARAMYVMSEKGSTKDEVLAFRADVYAKLKVAAASAGHEVATGKDGKVEKKEKKDKKETKDKKEKKEKKEKADKKEKKDEKEAMESDGKRKHDVSTAELRTEKKKRRKALQTVRIFGRDAGKESESINGMYSFVHDSYNNIPAYQSMSDGKAANNQRMIRYLFFSVKRECWMVHSSFSENRRGFAYAPYTVQRGTVPKIEKSLRWHVFDGVGNGMNEDLAVSSYIAEEGKHKSGGDPGEDEAGDDEAEAGNDDAIAVGNHERMEIAGEESPSSSSSSSSSAGSAGDGDAE